MCVNTEQALYEHRPSDIDVQPTEAWLAVMEQAHCNMSRYRYPVVSSKLFCCYVVSICLGCETVCIIQFNWHIYTSEDVFGDGNHHEIEIFLHATYVDKSNSILQTLIVTKKLKSSLIRVVV